DPDDGHPESRDASVVVAVALGNTPEPAQKALDVQSLPVLPEGQHVHLPPEPGEEIVRRERHVGFVERRERVLGEEDAPLTLSRWTPLPVPEIEGRGSTLTEALPERSFGQHRRIDDAHP